MERISSARASGPSPASGAAGREPVSSSVSVEADMATMSSTQTKVSRETERLDIKTSLDGAGRAQRTAGGERRFCAAGALWATGLGGA